MLNAKKGFCSKEKFMYYGCKHFFHALFIIIALILVSNKIVYSMQIINNDGLLTDINGETINQTVKMKFLLLDGKKSVIWTRERFVNVKNGIFSLRLGSANPINSKLINQNSLLSVFVKDNNTYKNINLTYQLNYSKSKKNINKFVYIDINSTLNAIIVDFSAHDALLYNSSNYSRDIPNICDTAFSKGIRDNFYLLLEKDQFILYQSMLCNEQFSSYQEYKEKTTSLGLSINISDVVIGLNGSQANKESTFKENYQKFCSSDYYESEFHSRYESKIDQINTELVKSWKECSLHYLDAWMELNKKGLYIDITPFDNFSQFLVTVKRSSVLIAPNIIESIGTNRAECYRGAEKIIAGETKIHQNEFTMVCSKNPTQEIPFLIETQEGFSNMVIVPKENGRIEELQTEINRIQSKTDELLKTIYEIKNKVQNISSEKVSECRICFQETQGSSQCQGHRNSCSGWSNNPSWSPYFRDDTDGRPGGCDYHWKIECR